MGERLRRARWSRELSLREVASTLDVSTNAVVRWEEGARPRTPELRKRLAKLYNIPEADLFREYTDRLAELAESLIPAVNGST